MLLHRFALDEVHYEVAASYVCKLFVDARKVGMCQTGQQQGFAIESGCRFGKFLGAETTLTHFFDGDEPVAKLEICGFVNSPKTTLADLLKNAITLLE